MCPSRTPDGEAAGLDRSDRRRRGQGKPIRRSCSASSQLCGGRDADIVVIPTASRWPTPARATRSCSTQLGAGRVDGRGLRHPRRRPSDDDRLARARAAPAASSSPAATSCASPPSSAAPPVAKLIRTRNAHGVHVAGTSAGASILSEHMIAFGKEGSSPTRRQRAPGARAGPDQPLHHRPAFPPARPPRPPARRAGLQPVRGRHRPGRGHRGVHRPGQHARSRRQRRGHRGRCRRPAVLVDGPGRRGPAGVPARPDGAPPGRRRHLQPAHAQGLAGSLATEKT